MPSRAFLLRLLARNPAAVVQVLRRQAAVRRRPATTFEELLAKLERSVPGFVASVRAHGA